MSVDTCDCEPWDVYPEARRHRARNEHVCSCCDQTIRRGDVYVYEFAVLEGQAETLRRCLRCQVIYEHLLERHSGIDDAGVDRELNCSHTYDEVFREDPPPEIERLAFMTPAEIQAEFAAPRAARVVDTEVVK